MGKKITVRDVCSTYGLSERTVRRYLAEGLLTATRVGPRLIRLDAEQVERALTGEPAA
jgi:excisionase family DNA binding protein